MKRSLWRTCSRSRPAMEGSTLGFSLLDLKGGRSFSDALPDAMKVLWRPTKFFDRFPPALPQQRSPTERSSFSFDEVAIGAFLPTCSREHTVASSGREGSDARRAWSGRSVVVKDSGDKSVGCYSVEKVMDQARNAYLAPRSLANGSDLMILSLQYAFGSARR
jgi:hypothetical protein